MGILDLKDKAPRAGQHHQAREGNGKGRQRKKENNYAVATEKETSRIRRGGRAGR